jgi:ribonuclease Z
MPQPLETVTLLWKKSRLISWTTTRVPKEAAETARDAGVGHLLYYHIVPPLVIPGQELLFLNGAEDIFRDYTVGRDGVSFSMPANSDEIVKTRNGL